MSSKRDPLFGMPMPKLTEDPIEKAMRARLEDLRKKEREREGSAVFGPVGFGTFPPVPAFTSIEEINAARSKLGLGPIPDPNAGMSVGGVGGNASGASAWNAPPGVAMGTVVGVGGGGGGGGAGGSGQRITVSQARVTFAKLDVAYKLLEPLRCRAA